MPCGNWDSERARARLVLTPGMIPSQTCMTPVKAHSTPLLCCLICATPRGPQKPFAGKESKDSLCPGALPVLGLPVSKDSSCPGTPQAPQWPGLRLSLGSLCPRAPHVSRLPLSLGSLCPRTPGQQVADLARDTQSSSRHLARVKLGGASDSPLGSWILQSI